MVPPIFQWSLIIQLTERILLNSPTPRMPHANLLLTTNKRNLEKQIKKEIFMQSDKIKVIFQMI